ncbi:MAG: ArnT family glycosyltransferase [Pirellulaceae bacterium]
MPYLRSDLATAFLLAGAALAVNLCFQTEGCGETDQAQLILVAAAGRDTGEWTLGDHYSMRTSPLVLTFLRNRLNAGCSVHALARRMNTANGIAGAATIGLLFLLWCRVADKRTAIATTLLFFFVPGFWISCQYGMPHVISFCLFVASLYCFSLTKDVYLRWHIAMYSLATVWMALACMCKADIILCGGAFGGMLVLQGETRCRRWLMALMIPAIGILLTLVYSRAVTPNAAPVDAFASHWHARYPFALWTLVEWKQISVNIYVFGKVIFLAVAGSVVVAAREKNRRRALWMALLWSAPQIVFWGLIYGNSARHIMAATAPFVFLVANVLYSRTWLSSRQANLAVVLIIVLNFFSAGPHPGLRRPSTRLFGSARALQRQIDSRRLRGREFVALARPRKLLLREDNSAYGVLEVLAHARAYHWQNGTLIVTYGDGRTEQIRRVRPRDLSQKDLQALMDEGWTVWSMREE